MNDKLKEHQLHKIIASIYNLLLIHSKKTEPSIADFAKAAMQADMNKEKGIFAVQKRLIGDMLEISFSEHDFKTKDEIIKHHYDTCSHDYFIMGKAMMDEWEKIKVKNNS